MDKSLRQRLHQTLTCMSSGSLKMVVWVWRILQGLSRLWWAGMQQAEGRAAREESETLERIRDRWRR